MLAIGVMDVPGLLPLFSCPIITLFYVLGLFFDNLSPVAPVGSWLNKPVFAGGKLRAGVGRTSACIALALGLFSTVGDARAIQVSQTDVGPGVSFRPAVVTVADLAVSCCFPAIDKDPESDTFPALGQNSAKSSPPDTTPYVRPAIPGDTGERLSPRPECTKSPCHCPPADAPELGRGR
jgi:hypothetical protein